MRMDLKELTPNQLAAASLKYPGARTRMLLYDLTGDGTIYPAEFNAWIENAVARVTARSSGEEVILPYKDDPTWLWLQFRDTVLELSWEVSRVLLPTFFSSRLPASMRARKVLSFWLSVLSVRKHHLPD